MTYRVKCVECPPVPRDAPANSDARYEGRYPKKKWARVARDTHNRIRHFGEDVATVVEVE